jgi:hypothetical protein
MKWAAGLVVIAACWTGTEAPPPVTAAQSPPPKPRIALDFKLRRTPCFGRCPAYTVEIAHDGKITWTGEKSVQVVGGAHAEIPAGDLRQLARAVEAAHFFDLDETGRPASPECTREPDGTMTCSSFVSFCSDTSHAVITVTRAGEAHTVDDAHCNDDNPRLLELEQLIDRVAGTRDWIGR